MEKKEELGVGATIETELNGERRAQERTKRRAEKNAFRWGAHRGFNLKSNRTFYCQNFRMIRDKTTFMMAIDCTRKLELSSRRFGVTISW